MGQRDSKQAPIVPFVDGFTPIRSLNLRTYTYEICSKKHPTNSFVHRRLKCPHPYPQIEKAISIFQQFRHKNLVQFIHSETFPYKSHYTVYDIITAKARTNLAHFIEKDPKYFDSADHIIKLLKSLAQVLSTLHIYKIIHANIRPSNVLLLHEYHWQLDIQIGPSTKPPSDPEYITFLAPELLPDAKNADYEKADIFSLGLVILYASGMQIPTFSGNQKDMQQYNTLLLEQIKLFGEKYQTETLKNILSVMLTTNYENRPRMHELKDIFHSFLEEPSNHLPDIVESFNLLSDLPFLPKDPRTLAIVKLIALPEKSKITSLLFVNENQFLTVSENLKLWEFADSTTSQPVKEFGGQNGLPLKLIQLSDKRLVVSCDNQTEQGIIEIWDSKLDELQRVIKGHRAPASCFLELNKNILISGSLDGSIIFWDLKREKDNELALILENSVQKSCTSMILVNKKYFAVSGCGSIHIYRVDGKYSSKPTFSLNSRDETNGFLALPSQKNILLSWARNKDEGHLTYWNWKIQAILKSIPSPEFISITGLKVYCKEYFLCGLQNGVVFWHRKEEKYIKLEVDGRGYSAEAMDIHSSGTLVCAVTIHEKELTSEDQTNSYIVFWDTEPEESSMNQD